MGWNSWNQVRCYDLTEDVVNAAHALVDRGLRDVGFEYVVVDDCWQGERAADGSLTSHPVRFPSGIRVLSNYVRSRGLKFGIYGVPGSETCANFWDEYPTYSLGSLGHEQQDAETFAAWRVDFLKYDWCRADETDGLDRKAAFSLMRDQLQATGRPIVYAISEYGRAEPWRWAKPIAHQWRTTEDIHPTWDSIVDIIDSQDGLAEFAGPGGWNDPDMLQFGNGDLSPEQNHSHFAMWCMLAAPLFLGTDISRLDSDAIRILTDRDLIAIDQDPSDAQPCGWAASTASRPGGDHSQTAVARWHSSTPPQTPESQHSHSQSRTFRPATSSEHGKARLSRSPAVSVRCYHHTRRACSESRRRDTSTRSPDHTQQESP